ncbi:MAG: efflux RND transporter periplasmic adaptor subunit [Steroidobacteraceae bacterium]
MSRRTIVIVGVAAVLLGGGWYLIARKDPRQGPGGPGFNPWDQPVPVRTVPAKEEDLSLQVRSIGTVTPFNTVVIRSRVDGTLLRLRFQEGQQVKQGELLAEIDSEPYRIRLAQAEGAQQQNVAQLRNAELELEQYNRVIAAGTIPRQTLDRQQALVNQLRGTIKSDQAQVDEARLQLSYTRIVAPLSGRVGLRRVDAGNLISANSTDGLATITQTQPISVLLTIPEADLPNVRAGLAAGPLVVQAWDRNGRERIADGQLRTLDNQIDATTGTLRLKAEFANKDDALFPNQFVNTVVEVGKLPGAVTVPADAVQHGSRGTYVYVVVEGKAQLRDVKLGPTVAGRTAVTEGVKAGEAVVLEGLDRLREGSPVTLVAEDGTVTPPPPGAARPQGGQRPGGPFPPGGRPGGGQRPQGGPPR